ncbi:MAG: high potential iron sulfur protein [Alphaproteobacteria bacterium]|nr:high potential iron sulfur protein [Alphaproteobacteria bacterium]
MTGFSRRTLLSGLIAASLASEAKADKLPQKVVQYQDTPKAGHQCSKCAHFHAPSSCDVVQGTISPRGWCRMFSPKVGE